MSNNNEFFYCHSPNLHRYLRDRGQRYICAGLNVRTKLTFWQYRRSDELSALLDEWHANRPTR